MIDMQLKVLTPRSCQQTELDAFEALVKQGGEVQTEGLGERIKTAKNLGFVRHWTDEVVSVAAVKYPLDEYREKVFDSAAARPYMAQFGDLELGWAYTVPNLRRLGFCSLLTSLLLSYTEGGVFATCRTTNTEIIGILQRNGFTRLGKPYQGRTAPILLYGRAA